MIKLFVLDVDGTLTDGNFYIDGEGHEFKKFNVQDGYGLVSLLSSGVKVVFLSGRFSKATDQRAKELKITRCFNGSKNKLKDLILLTEQYGVKQQDVFYIGDDVPDEECIKWAGVGACPANAVPRIKKIADYVTSLSGGNGAIRECCDIILDRNGKE